ncbi:hypothetical protein F5J12DRAFT_779767 [Pisolithus orientalis]|uniref:uncharacterized protein n=1 Tax=Pisolithus orientalis TaxID=936130 RepID=UPI002224B5C8|nr:uncharacterized protein F5J12DRAFT_779767 [Pisolithus orientalis]KAI6030672.1 hypothetical protein F5J12DRAFT_779767 [Pisolithus orientalis]
MTLIAQYWRFVSAATSPKVLRKLTFWVAQTEYHCSGFQLEFHLIPSSHNAPVSKQVKKGGAVVSNNGVQHSEQSTPKDMIGKLKLQFTVQPLEGWEEHMIVLRDRRHSLTPCPSIMNTSMLPSPFLHLDDQICDEDSAMEEVEENPDNNEDEDDQPSSNENEDDRPSSSENEDDLPSGSKKEHDWLPSSDDDNKGSDYNENENDDEEMESLSNSCEGGLIYTRLQKKGKGRAIDAEDIDAANHGDHDTQLPNLKKPGNLSTAALDKIRAFAKDIKTTVEELG